MEDITGLPMYVNLGLPQDWQSHLGFADITKNEETNEIEITIRISQNAVIKFENMVDVFKLQAIGFAGRKRLDTE